MQLCLACSHRYLSGAGARAGRRAQSRLSAGLRLARYYSRSWECQPVIAPASIYGYAMAMPPTGFILLIIAYTCYAD